MRAAWLGSLAAGLVLMLGFDHALTRVLGLLCLAAFIAIGVVLIAQPEFLDEDGDGDSGDRERADRG